MFIQPCHPRLSPFARPGLMLCGRASHTCEEKAACGDIFDRVTRFPIF